MKDSYEDIIRLPHHVSATHPQMPAADRAAQFSPFAALTGYGDIIAETSRNTDIRIEPDEDLREELDLKLRILAGHVQNPPEVTLTYFQPNLRKEGGTYRTIVCRITKIDPAAQMIRTEDGLEIPVSDLRAVDGASDGSLPDF